MSSKAVKLGLMENQAFMGSRDAGFREFRLNMSLRTRLTAVQS
jgi:hypothetical protein